MKKFILLAGFVAFAGPAFTQGTAFTYQGRLDDGTNPANGTYDLQFALFDAASAGTQQSGTWTQLAQGVTNGLFTVTLDFGSFFPGADRWLEIGVRTNGGSTFTTLTPRQKFTAAPYAITAGNLSGNITAAQLPSTVVTNGASGVTLTGSFTGNGANVTNVNAATLGGLTSSNFWRTGGNAGTTAGTHFLGTTDNQALELRVNNARALRLQPDPSPANAPSLIGGSSVNVIAPGIVGATIAGGGSADYEGGGPTPNTVGLSYGTVSGGVGNNTAGVGATIAGGYNNTSAGFFATVSGGGINLAHGDYTFVGGGLFNQATNSASTVAGGRNNRALGRYSSVGGGTNGVAAGDFSTIAGGFQNLASGLYATVAGGTGNASEDLGSTVAGGLNNTSSFSAATVGGGSANISSGQGATVCGGTANTAAGSWSTTAGGAGNAAHGRYSFAAGRSAMAEHHGAFVWADTLGGIFDEGPFASTGPRQFLIRAEGGVGIGHNAPDAPLHVVGGSDANLAGGGTFILEALGGANLALDGNEIQARNNGAASTLFFNAGGGNVSIGTTTANARLRVVNATCDGEVWSNSSDRHRKAGFASVDAMDILAKVAALPMQSWHYTNAPGTRHVGPMAQDFHAAFGIGGDDKTIATVDADGVALAAIQGLNQKLEQKLAQKETEITELKQELAAIKHLLGKLAIKED